MKKFVGAAACTALAMTCLALPVQAASGDLNAAEQRLLDMTEKGVTIEGNTLAYAPGSDEYETLKEYLTVVVDLSDADVDNIKKDVENVSDYIKKNGKTEMKAGHLQTMLSMTTTTQKIMKMNFSYDAEKDLLIVKDDSGNTITSTKMGLKGTGTDKKPTVGDVTNKVEKLEQTGEDFTSTYLIFGSLAIVLGAAGVVVLRKKEVTE